MTEKHEIGSDGILEDGTRMIPVTSQDFALYDQAKQLLSQLPAPILLHADDPHERLFSAFFDGTGNDAKNDPEHVTSIGIFKDQIDDLSNRNPHVASHYLTGPGMQSHFLPRISDGAIGYTYDARIEEMYDALIRQVKIWREEDPNAQIRIVAAGFSRGAEQAAGFTRLLHERGIQDPAGEKVHHHWFRPDTFTYSNPPLIAPGQTPQAVMLFDPVGTGRPYSRDRQLPPSVVSGLQITARDERRDAFPSTLIIPQGASQDGRFLNVTVPGAHSDVGGSYHHNGLAILNRNLAVDYLNALSDTPLLTKQAEPKDMNEYMIHRSEDHQKFYGIGYALKYGVRGERGTQVGAPDCRATIACLPPQPEDPAVAAQIMDRHPVSVAPAPTRPSQPHTVATPAPTSADIALDLQHQLEQLRLQAQQHLQAQQRLLDEQRSDSQASLQAGQPLTVDRTPTPAAPAPIPAHLQDMRHPEHPIHGLYRKTLDAVHTMEDRRSITHGPHSEWLAATFAERITAFNIGKTGDDRIFDVDRLELRGPVGQREVVLTGKRYNYPAVEHQLTVDMNQEVSRPVTAISEQWARRVMPHLYEPKASVTDHVPSAPVFMLPTHDPRRPNHLKHTQYQSWREQVSALYAHAGITRSEAQIEQATSAVMRVEQERVMGKGERLVLKADERGVIGPNSGILIWDDTHLWGVPVMEVSKQQLQTPPEQNYQEMQQLAQQQAFQEQQRAMGRHHARGMAR